MGGGGLGGGGQMGTGELRSFGYQQHVNGKGPVRATDLGVGGYGGFGSNYDSYEQSTHSGMTTKSSIQNSNYRKAFNPDQRSSDMRSSHYEAPSQASQKRLPPRNTG